MTAWQCRCGLRVQDLGFKVWGLGFSQDLEFRF